MVHGIYRLLAAGLMTSALAATAQAETLKFAHVFPADHYLWTQGGKVFAEAVTKASEGRIAFEVYPAGQLGKDAIAVQRSGLAELAMVIPAYSPDKLPLSSVAELPGMYASACQGTRMFWNVAKPGAILDELELKGQGMRVLFASTIPPLKIATKNRPVGGLADLKGLKLRAAGSAMNKTVRALGATPIQLTAGEMFDSLSRGTVDGALWYYHSTPTFGLEDVLNNAVEGVELGGGTLLYTISTTAWDRLSPEDQEIFATAAADAQTALCEWLDAEESRVRDDLAANHDWQISTPPAEEMEQWQALINDVTVSWAKEIDDNGQAGTQVLQAFRDSAE